jgi:16S rRNA (cytidine1402-2'-O)-methyltransferase
MKEDPGLDGGGALFVVATPIGNLRDITARAVEVLRAADIIAAEDTRHSSALFAHISVAPSRLVSLHDHNEQARIPELIAAVRAGSRVALVSDAGTPLVSDPGYRLVLAAHEAGLRVSPVPGACAAVAALSAAGLPSDRFAFEGFLPASRAARRARLATLAASGATLVFYEAPHRVAESLSDMVDAFGAARRAVIAREITKTYETIRRDTLVALCDFVHADSQQQRGEIVLLVEGAAEREQAAAEIDRTVLLRALASELPAASAARVAASVLREPRRDLYRQLLELGADGS